MAVNSDELRRAQHNVRAVAMNFSIEVALNALGAVAAEAIIAATSESERPKLLRVFDDMVRDFVRQAEHHTIDAGGVN